MGRRLLAKRQPLEGDDASWSDSQNPMSLWAIWGTVQQVAGKGVPELKREVWVLVKGRRGLSLRLATGFCRAPLPVEGAEGQAGLDPLELVVLSSEHMLLAQWSPWTCSSHRCTLPSLSPAQSCSAAPPPVETLEEGTPALHARAQVGPLCQQHVLRGHYNQLQGIQPCLVLSSLNRQRRPLQHPVPSLRLTPLLPFAGTQASLLSSGSPFLATC